MEDVVLRMPKSDVTLLAQFAKRMGWTIDERRSVVARFIEACQRNAGVDFSEEDIQTEVNAVRYKS